MEQECHNWPESSIPENSYVVYWVPCVHLHIFLYRYMKGRVTYDQLNAAVQSINTAVTAKYKILYQPVKTLNNMSRLLQQRFKDQETKDTKGITVLSVCCRDADQRLFFIVLTVLSFWELRVGCLLQKTINATTAEISALIIEVIYPGLVFNKHLRAERCHPSTSFVSHRSVLRRGARHQRVCPAEGGQAVCWHVKHATPLPAPEGGPRRWSYTIHLVIKTPTSEFKKALWTIGYMLRCF